jgi:hypothetical protein
LLAIGDALCSFDPAFGQGMSVAALSARALSALLAEDALTLDGLAPRYFARAARLIDAPWSMARPRPTQVPHAAPGSWMKRWLRVYQRELLRAAAHSPALHLAFVRVVNLEAPPTSLLAPALAARVLAARVGRALATESAPRFRAHTP